MTTLMLGRALFGITMAFHIIFATLGVGIPVLISLAELIGILKKDNDYILMARRWTKGFVVLVAVGVVTGTIVGFNLSLLWPQFMKQFAPAIALPFLIEVFAFFIEAVFMALYVYAWDRFRKPIHHWLCTIPIVIGAGASGMLITTANSFMNTPAGFTMKNGHVTDVHPLAAMWNPATPTEILHVLISAYLTSAFVIGAIPAWNLMCGKVYPYFQKGLHLAMWVACISGILTPLIGDAAGKFLADYQPEKLAAGEALFKTTTNAPLVIGGIIHSANQSIQYGIKIPYMLSFLAHSSFHTKVIGLDAFPKDTWPPLVVHYFFDGMVGLGTYLLAIAVVYLILRLRRFDWLFQKINKPFLFLIFLGGPAAVLAMELGWMYDEVGRQPWIVVGYMRVAAAVTQSLYLKPILILFVLIYIFITVLVAWILPHYFKRHPIEDDLAKTGGL
jgi:cytochrome bd ubiquinol oxidase subunit I